MYMLRYDSQKFNVLEINVLEINVALGIVQYFVQFLKS